MSAMDKTPGQYWYERAMELEAQLRERERNLEAQCEINGLLQGELAVTAQKLLFAQHDLEERERELERLRELVTLALDAPCAEACGEYGSDWHAASCPKTRAEGNLYSALLTRRPAPEETNG